MLSLRKEKEKLKKEHVRRSANEQRYFIEMTLKALCYQLLLETCLEEM